MADASPPATRNETIEVAGNRLTLLIDGPERLEALVALIEGARKDLRVLYYMFLDDSSGVRVRDALIAAVIAQRTWSPAESRRNVPSR